MDLKDSLKLIQDTAKEAAKVQLTTIPGDPDKIIVAHGSSYAIRDLPDPHRRHTVHDLDGIARWAEWVADTGEEVVWHDDSEVMLTMDFARRDTVRWPLERTAIYRLVSSPDFCKSRDQDGLIRLLRVDLDGAAPPDLLGIIRRLKFQRGEETNLDKEAAKASLGRKVEASVTGAGAIPETVEITGRVYRNFPGDDRFVIRCALDVNLETQRFTLTPCGDEVAQAMDDAQAVLHGALVDRLASIPVYHGCP